MHVVFLKRSGLVFRILNDVAWCSGSGKGSGSGGGSSTLSSVASILGMKGITITKDSSNPTSNGGVPNSLINIKVK